MADRKVVLSFIGNTTSLQRSFADVQRGSAQTEGAVGKVSTSFRSFGKEALKTSGILTAGIAAAFVGAGAAALKSATQFDTAMRNVSTISQAARADFAGVSQELLDLSRTLPQSATILAEGLYEVASSGFDGADGLAVVTAAAEAASAGLTDTAVSAKAITAVLNAYGRQAGDAADISDVLFQTVNLGVISFEELAQNMGDIVGIGAAAGVAVDELGAAMATMTLSGTPAAEAATSLSRLLTSMIKPSDALTALFHEMGFESGQAALAALGLQGVMEKVGEATNGEVAALQALFPEIRATRGAFGLLAQDGDTFARVAGEITDQSARAGATQRALAEQSKSLSFQWARLKNNISATAIELSSKALPAMVGLLDAVMNTAKAVGPGLGGALKTVGGLLNEIGGFVATHRGYVMALAAAYAVTLVPALVATSAQFVIMSVTKLWASLDLAVTSVRVLALEMGRLRMAMAATGFGVAVLALGGYVTAVMNARRRSDELVASIEKKYDLSSLDQVGDATDELRDKYDAAIARLDEYHNPVKAFFTNIVQTVGWGESKLQEASTDVDRLGEAWEDMAGRGARIDDNLNQVAHSLGLTTEEVERLANATGIDLAGGFQVTTGALYDAYNAATKGSPAIQELDKAMLGLNDAVADGEDRLKAFKDALDAALGMQLNLEESTSKIEAGFDSLTDSVTENGKTLSLTTVEGRANASAVRDVIDAVKDDAVARAEQGESYDSIAARLATNRQRLVAEMTQLGLTKAEIDRYATAYDSIPAVVQTQIKVDTSELDAALTSMTLPVAGVPGALRPRGGYDPDNPDRLAEGRVTRTPQIRSSAVLWAEAGPEAYIPLGPAHRSSAQTMTVEVGRILGVPVAPMAAGGMWGVPAGAGDRSAAGMGMSNADMSRLLGALEKTARRRPVERMQNVFNEKVDPLHVAQKIAWKLAV